MKQPTRDTAEPVLSVSDLRVEYPGRQRLLGRGNPIRALRGVSFDLKPGETVAIVGESGSGKSTLAKALSGLTPTSGGEVRLRGESLVLPSGKRRRDLQRRIAMVFQDPYSSLNPRVPVGKSVALPLRIQGELNEQERDQRVVELLERVGISPQLRTRPPSAFSGGQRQRLAIARALATGADVLICDESVSALDVSTQSQIIELLREIQDNTDLAILFIAHDLGPVSYIAHKILVLYLGMVMETGPSPRLLHEPQHPYTKALVAAAPRLHHNGDRQSSKQALTGEVPSAINPPSGCPFRTRCPEAMDVCADVVPYAYPVEHGGVSWCHLHDLVEDPITAELKESP